MGRYDQFKGKKSGRYKQAKNKTSSSVGVPLVIILVIFAGAGGFYFAKKMTNGITIPDIPTLTVPFTAQEELSKSDAPDNETEATVDSETVADNLEELPQAEEQIILPELDSSDEWVREALTQVSPGLAQWLDTDQLIRNYMIIINDFSQGLRIDKHMRFVGFTQPFTADEKAAGLFMASKSYQRYNKLAAAIAAMDEQAVVTMYKKMKPLLLQVFAEFSYPEEYSLDGIFTKAAEQILAAPVIDGQIALVRHSIRYKFADPALEALNPVQKQMIRMGPENTRIIQDKVRLLVEGLSDSKE
ncbi:MAG: DUF3014 domain-containing protein [Methylococcaceae bacterium]